MELTIEIGTDDDGGAVLSVSGSIDLESRGRLLEAGRDALRRPGTTGLAVDLSGVTFLDSTGLGALIELAQLAEDAGKVFAVWNPSDRAVRVLEVTRLTEALNVVVKPGPRPV